MYDESSAKVAVGLSVPLPFIYISFMRNWHGNNSQLANSWQASAGYFNENKLEAI
jgi:hypothetical protein